MLAYKYLNSNKSKSFIFNWRNKKLKLQINNLGLQSLNIKVCGSTGNCPGENILVI